MRLSEKEAAALGIVTSKPKRSKYNAKRVTVDGIRFDSRAEADFYVELKNELKLGLIAGFCRQARFVVTEGKNGDKGTEYLADFVVFYPDGTYRIIDVKGMKTEVFKLKQKCFTEKYPNLKIELEESF